MMSVGTRTASLLLLSVVLSLPAGCSSYGADRKLDDAARLGAEGRTDEALALIKEVESDYPDTDAARRAAKMRPLYEGLVDARLRYPVRGAVDTLREVTRAIEAFRSRHGTPPDRLERLVPDHLTAVPRDSWGNGLVYRPTGDGYALISLGEDGRAGGEGPSMDLEVRDGRLTAAPSWAAW